MSMSKFTITESGLIDRCRIRYRSADLVPVDPGWQLVHPGEPGARATSNQEVYELVMEVVEADLPMSWQKP